MAQKVIKALQAEFEISYELTNINNKSNTIMFLHGWGSNKDIMKQAFKNTLNDYCHLYVDMPGFGKSNLPISLHTIQYATIIQELLNSLEITPNMIIGHSFGGKVATLLNPKIIVLLSSAGIKTQKSIKVRSKIAVTKILNKIAPNLAKIFKNSLRSKDVYNADENLYQTFKNVVDEDFSDIFENFTNKAFIFWGRDDLITPLTSGKIIHSKIKDSKFIELDGDHFFFLQQANKIQKVLDC